MDKLDKVMRVIVPLITALTAIMVGYLNYKISSVNTDINKRDQALKGRLAQLDQDLKRAEADRIERESLQSFNFRIYDAVIGSLESGNP